MFIGQYIAVESSAVNTKKIKECKKSAHRKLHLMLINIKGKTKMETLSPHNKVWGIFQDCVPNVQKTDWSLVDLLSRLLNCWTLVSFWLVTYERVNFLTTMSVMYYCRTLEMTEREIKYLREMRSSLGKID